MQILTEKSLFWIRRYKPCFPEEKIALVSKYLCNAGFLGSFKDTPLIKI